MIISKRIAFMAGTMSVALLALPGILVAEEGSMWMRASYGMLIAAAVQLAVYNIIRWIEGRW
jgi:hypothetical protein